ncbi:hypothetical protein EB235_30945 [Mesorhizobium loti R88b]|uniref:Uncharacterized protein n=1 Tax=Mesorhizobium loti R88b TaxID=935548 RepID=A0A6M7WMP0_RHILI|nr:hypothetical protein EB235_30945 [Mesorhizobium loti R88b]
MGAMTISLGFFESFQPFWVVPQPKFRVLMDKAGMHRVWTAALRLISDVWMLLQSSRNLPFILVGFG